MVWRSQKFAKSLSFRRNAADSGGDARATEVNFFYRLTEGVFRWRRDAGFPFQPPLRRRPRGRRAPPGEGSFVNGKQPLSQRRLMNERPLRVLHVGCGPRTPKPLPPPFNAPPWSEVRLDIDPSVAPDIVASITDMGPVPAGSFDAILSSHNLEHLYPHQVPVALGEFLRVLGPEGFAVITLPDLQQVAEWILDDRLLDQAYVSAGGPVHPIDILYGFRPAVAAGNLHMAHRGGFTASALEQSLLRAGFASVDVRRDGHWSLWAVASKREEDQAATAFLADFLTTNGENGRGAD